MKWYQALNKKRPSRTQGREPTRYLRLLFGLLIGLMVIGTFLVNVVAVELGDRYTMAFDLTANAAFEVGEETRVLLQGLDQDVEIYVLATEDGFGGSSYLLQAQRMIEQYPKLSPRVELTYVDYVFDPTFASRYPDLDLSEGDVLVTSGDRTRQLQLSDLFNYTQAQGGRPKIQSSRTEEALTSAILYVVSGDRVRVAVLTGNGNAQMTAFTDLLVENNFEVVPVNLATERLGDDYDLALLLGPQIDLSEDAINKLDAFLYNDGAYGKTLLYTADVSQESLSNVETYLNEWGVDVDGGAVFETTAERTYQYQPYYPVVEYADETYREMLIDASAPVLMPLAKPLDLRFEARDNYVNDVLLQFTETSGVRPPEAVEGFSVEQAERWGPMPALIVATARDYGTTGTTQSRSNLVVSASTAMLDGFSIQNTSLSNSEYLLNLFNDLCEREDVVTIRPKSLSGQTLAINTARANTLGIVLAGVLPLGILTAGIVIWLIRRYQ
jgi:hypothetical protein